MKTNYCNALQDHISNSATKGLLLVVLTTIVVEQVGSVVIANQTLENICARVSLIELADSASRQSVGCDIL